MKRFLSTPLYPLRQVSLSHYMLRPNVCMTPVRFYSAELDPASSKDYGAYVEKWSNHFKTCEDDFELERGLNHIFSADWVPSVGVIQEALKASRRLNTFATAVRILEALEQKAYKKEHFDEYMKELSPLLTELGVPQRKELGDFEIIRHKKFGELY